MLTPSKRWAIVTGFVIVGVAIVLGAYGLRAHRTADSTIAALVAPSPATPPVTPSSIEATARTADAAKTKAAAPPADVPHFDVVRVEPTGESVLAGQGAPNSSVELMDAGKVIAQAPTDANGHFVMLPPTLRPGDYALSLRQQGAAPSESTQSVAVSVPVKGKGQVVVAMAEPGRATKLMSPPPIAMPGLTPASKNGPEGAVQRALAAATSDAQPFKPQTAFAKEAGLAVRSVELENGNGFFASGAAAPGTKLHVYLNNSHLAEVTAGGDGNWSVKIKKGLTGGHYVVRADAAAGAQVAARVEVPFDVPVAMAEANSAPKPATVASLATPGPVEVKTSSVTDAVIDEVSTAMVHSGDNLWDISRVRLGQGRRYTRIYAANVTQIRNPSLIYPGQVFVLPPQND
ncbi:LysM peptidoglycan-binding domain-containing protein [Beijerinckia sp. L45]|uniref:LysM peptidoglycan-binding domain-containing protein n=1 Tax=Beijerinckia sp. L45 TaxID=1641855 RepID=UPI00131CCE05|nr:LysM peptidoglycan-binding domain-containing protein [Beijerinckia sp. L45]